MLGDFRVGHDSYGHPALDESKVFKYGYNYISHHGGNIYGYADAGHNVSFWVYNGELRVSGLQCIGKIYKNLSEKDKELFKEEIETLAREFSFFDII